MIALNYDKAVSDGLSLFNMSEGHRAYTVSDLQTYLILPIKYNTIRLYYRDDQPIGLVTWCWLSEENSNLFLNGKYHPTEEDHDSTKRTGKELWGMELIAPYGDARRIMRLIRSECLETYGMSDVHWRRFHDQTRKRKRKFR